MRHCVDICLEIVFFKWGNLVRMNGFGMNGLGKKGGWNEGVRKEGLGMNGFGMNGARNP